MARTEITLPQLGESVTEGTVTAWLKQVGDPVALDDLLFEVSTDKVDSEVPSPVAGYLAEILVPEGETVDVGTVVAVVSDEAAGGGTAPAPSVSAAPAPPPAPPAPAAAPAPAPPPPPPAPAAAPPTPAPVPAPVSPAASTPAGAAESQLLSPVVRRLVAEHGLDPAQIEGTGEGGRVTRDDVLRLVEARGGNGAATPTPAAASPAPSAGVSPATGLSPTPTPAPTPAPARPAAVAAAAQAGGREEVAAFSNIRRRTAEHMVMSKATSPHATVAMEIDYENLDRVRRRYRESFKAGEGFSLTYLPFIARACIDAIREFPEINAAVDGDALVVHRYVNLGIAVDLDFKGLIVPAVRDADTKRLRQIAREIHDVATRAKGKKLSPDDLIGATFTITNVGPYGTLLTVPIINQPQVAILSTDGVKKRPVVVESADGDSIAIHATGNLSLTWDHRAVDGAYCAAFLKRVQEIIQTRDWEAELA